MTAVSAYPAAAKWLIACLPPVFRFWVRAQPKQTSCSGRTENGDAGLIRGAPVRGSRRDLAFVAAGRYDGFWERGLSLWDIAAGYLLVKAGGFVSDFASRDLSRPLVISSRRTAPCMSASSMRGAKAGLNG